MMEMDNPRQLAKKAIKASVPAALWSENESFVAELRTTVNKHPVAKHPAIEALNQAAFSKEGIKRIHLDYRHAIVQSFTDALLIAQYLSHKRYCDLWAEFWDVQMSWLAVLTK